MCGLTYEDREEENGNRDVEDRTGDVKEPVGSHREETKKKEKEEQTATIFFHLFFKNEGKRAEDEEQKKKKVKGGKIEMKATYLYYVRSLHRS